MKTNLRQKAKSALSILLTLCMIFSVLTVAITSVGAASFRSSAMVYFDNSQTNWSAVYLVYGKDQYNNNWYYSTQMSKISGTDLYYCKPSTDWSGSVGNNLFFVDGSGETLPNGTKDFWASKRSNFNHYTDTKDMSLSDSTSYLFVPTSGTNGTAFSNYSSISSYSTLNKNLTIKSMYSSDGTAYTESTSTKYGTFSVSGAYKMSGNGTSTTSSVSQTYGSATLTTARTNTATLSQTAEDEYTFMGWSESSGGTGLSSGTYSFENTGSAKTVYAYYKDSKTTLNTPTNVQINSNTTYAVNAGDSSTTTLTWTGDSNASGYTIYKDGTQVGTTSGASSTSYTLTNATASAGVYTVQATTTDTVNYKDSDVSTSSATLTVYEPVYSLSGNIINYEALTIGGSTPAKTTPTYPDTWFNQYQSTYAINNTTGTAGVYSLTFKVKEDYQWTPYVCIANSSNEQKAFIYNDTAYNTATLGDLEVPDAGISSGLYLYPLASENAGGSLQLKAGQTYTITIDQRERFDSSSPYGKVTITATDAYVDAVAKKMAYNPTNRDYDSVSDAADTIGTATAVPYHGTKGNFTSTLTATVVNSNYSFTGWYDNADCTGTAVSTSATYNVENPANSVSYYALFTQSTPTDYAITVTQPGNSGTITFTGGVDATGTSSTTAYQGATVSMSATVTEHSKEFSHWLITNASDVDITSTVCANPTLQTTTFTMPASNVKVTAIYSNKTQVTITTSSNNTSLGTASYTSGTYYVGDTINISATNRGGVFSRWVVTGGTVANAGSASTTIVATGSTVTARAIFDYKTYQLYYNGKYYPLIRQDDGTYVSSFKIPSNSSDFTVYNASDKKYAVSGTGNTWEFNSGTRDATIYNTTTANNNAWASSAGKLYKNTSAGAAAYMVFYPPGYIIGSTTYENGRISLVTTNPMGTIAQIYAKDGSIRYYDSGKSSGDLWEQSTGGPTANRGVTVVTKINSTAVSDPDSSKYPSTNPTLSDHLKIYSAPIGSTITIQTTLNDTYKNQGFYVGMFVINGWKVAASDAGKGVYTATYTLTDEYAEENLDGNDSFEITPVYYNKNFDYITFYVDADSVPDKWGSTISACADYNGATNAHFEGTYPGQPLGREGDLYELKVAKYYYTYSNGTWSALTQYHPSATITAYNFDLVHHYYYVNASDDIYSASTNDNYQTYDYSDFAYLAQIEDIEAILFKCKYETSKNNWQIYGKDDSAANYDPNSTEPSWYNVSTNTALNTWQWLTDYYGNPIDAFGNRIVKSGSGDSAVYYTAEDLASLTTTSNEQVRIVSYGNRKTDSNSSARTSAKWATGWVVYTKGSTSGTKYFKAYGTPADFICTTPGDTSTSNAKYYSGGSASDIEGKLTIISYDKERTNQISGVGDTGERIDGQWYYSAQHEFDSTVQVHITTQEGTAITSATVDADSSTAGTNDGWEGTTSKTVATLDGKTTETYSNVTTEAALNCTPGSGYTFVGWYIYDGTNYTKIGDNFADQNTAMTMKKNYTIVAVVRKVGAGDLVITHSRYTGSKPEAHDGNGKYYVSAVLNKGTASEKTIAEAQNSITVSGLKATDKLTITIRTVCNGADTFYAWYEEALGADYSRTGNYYEICSETEDPLGESEVSYTFFEADCSTFFEGSTLKRNTIDLYSDIVHVSAYATLTYKYYDRFAQNGKNQMVSYVVKDVPLTDAEIDNGYIPSDEKIAKYAPKVVDTIYTDTKWTIAGTKVERAASNVTLMATQTPKTCFVEYLPGEQVGDNLLKNQSTEVPVEDIVTWNTRIVNYNDWLIDENADLNAPDESDFYVNAPTTYTDGGNTWTFVRFDVYEYNRLTGEIGNVIYSSNDHTFGYRIYADCVIYPVYVLGETVEKELTAKIEPAVLNREVYGDSLSPTDKLYADLLISFINVALVTGNDIPEEIKDLAADSGYSIETGFVLDKTVYLSDADFNTLKTAAQAGATDTTDTILKSYTGQFNAETAKTVAKGTATSGFSKYVLDNSKLTNKNRTDGVVRFTNSETAQKKVYAAYSYIIINKGSTEYAFAISDAQLFNFCYLGNKPLDKVS